MDTNYTLTLMSDFINDINISLVSPKKNNIHRSRYSNKHKQRCSQCMKKISMISFTCKCGNMYCITHQTPHMHKCSYDYKLDLQKKIEKDNPKLGQKINPI